MAESKKINMYENEHYRYCGSQIEDRINHKFLVKATGETYTLVQSPFYSFQSDDFEYTCNCFEENRLKYSSIEYRSHY